MEYNTYTEKYKSKRKEAVVITAAELFLSRGIEDVKMTDIAESCGIGVASLYRYFGTKTSIVIAAGTLLWDDLKKLFEGVYECDYFAAKTGREQIRDLMKYFSVLFASHKEFLRFIANFDDFVLANRVAPGELAEYEKNVLNFYPLFLESWRRGCADGSVRADIDCQSVYFSVSHALLAMSQKFLKGEVMQSDDFSHADRELALITDMAMRYIST